MNTNVKLMENKRKLVSVNYIAKIAILGAAAWVVMLLDFAMPFIFPVFLKLDFSDLIPLIGSLAMGPVAGILIQLLKNLLHLTVTTTSGIGELANFIVGSSFVTAAGLYYKHHKTKKGAFISLLLGIVSIVSVAAIVNYSITVPLYSKFIIPYDAIINAASKVVPAIHDKFTLILFAFCPFNLLKGVVLSLITWPIYKKLSPILQKGLW